MENELFRQFLNQLTDEDLRKIVLNRKIGIEGFRVTQDTLKLVPSIKLKNGIEAYIRKTNIKSLFNTKEDYNKLKERNVALFNFRVLYDLYKNINVNVISSLLTENVDKNENIVDKKEIVDINLIKDKEEKDELKIENAKLIKSIRLLEKQLKQKQEDFVKQQNLNQKEKIRLDFENKRLKEQIQYLNNSLSELKNKNIEKESEIQLLNDKIIYYTSLIKLNKILLFNLHPLDDEFPYSYKCIKTLEDFQEILLNEKISDFWYLEKSLNPFEINKIYKFMKDENISINIQELSLQNLKLLKLGEYL